MKLSKRLILSFLAVVIVSTVVVGILSIISIRDALRQDIKSELITFAESKEGQVFAYFDSIESRTIDFSSDGFIRDNLKKINLGSSEAVKSLNEYLVKNKQSLDETIAGILIIDLNGIVVASTHEDEIGKNESGDDYFVKGKQEVYVSDFIGEHYHFTEKDAFVVGAPLTNKQTGELLGVIVNIFYIDKLQKILSGEFQLEKKALIASKGVKETLEIYIVDLEKRMFVHPVRREGKDSSNVAEHFAEMIIDNLPVQRCLENNEEIFEIYETYDGEIVVGASMCLQEKGWTIVVEISKQEVFAPLNQLIKKLIIIFIIIVILASLLAIFISNGISKPIKKLTNDVDDITKGKLDIQLEKSNIFEIQKLTDSLNRILASLKLAILKTGTTKEELGLGEAIKAKKEAEIKVKKKAMQLERFAKLSVGREQKMIELKKRIRELEGKSGKKFIVKKDVKKIVKKNKKNEERYFLKK